MLNYTEVVSEFQNDDSCTERECEGKNLKVWMWNMIRKSH
jgi:hypothetical protein